jgi:hypothetical protein
MSYLIIIDEPALKECIETHIYQTRNFPAGLALARALCGDRTVTQINIRLVPIWHKDCLYILKSRVQTGYVCIDSSVLSVNSIPLSIDTQQDDALQIFQRICRFCIKDWNALRFSFSERWSNKSGCGVVFPFPKSRSSAYRVAIRKPSLDARSITRHGERHLFAFAGGNEECEDTTAPTHQQELAHKRALESLSDIRRMAEIDLKRAEAQPTDSGYHPLVLSRPPVEGFRVHSYEEWMSRLTSDQQQFVACTTPSPQRVEGPAGTGKTLCLLLRAFFLCRNAASESREFRVLFIAHSEATRNAISLIFDSLRDGAFHMNSRTDSMQSIEVFTLQGWCGRMLGSAEVSNAQYLDQDALGAKEMRKLMIKDAVSKRLQTDRKSLEYLSSECEAFFNGENSDYQAEILQHEFGVMIKGRANENLDLYLTLPHLSYCLPAPTENDRRFIFSLFKEYQREINIQGVFDTDDIVLSTLGRLETPIWRRRRLTEGYDAILVDETHLFNLNELSVLHHLLRDDAKPRISFSIDRSQALGERGITNNLVKEVLTPSAGEIVASETKVVFRCAPPIVRLAEAITATGASLFATFENPLLESCSVISASDEELVQDPILWKCLTDSLMCAFATARAKALLSTLRCSQEEVLIVCTSEELLTQMKASLASANAKFVSLVSRGDIESVSRGARDHAFILAHPDFVGGLEFKAVLIVGVDEGRIPPSEGVVKQESKHFLCFKACNRLYVAISRGRLIVELFYNDQRGKSALLNHALDVGAIEMRDSAEP